MPLTEDELREIGYRIRRAGSANCWTGTTGSIAADARRLWKHIEERRMCEYPVDHILRGEAELRQRHYLGDEAGNDAFAVLTEDDAAEVVRETTKATQIGTGEVIPQPEDVRPGTDKFLEVLREIANLHVSKSLDYGQDEDALANIRAGAEAINVPAWLGCVLRMSDKMQRIRAFCRRGKCEHDGIEDTLLDIAAYAAIALVVYREASAPPPPG